MKGRPPKTEQTLKAQGTFEKSKQGGRVAQPPVEGIPPAPAGFTAAHKKWWEAYIKDIKAYAVLTEAHLHAVELMCRLMVEREGLDKDVREKGHTFETGSGQIKINPAFTALRQVDAQLIKLYEQFGFTLRSSMNLKTEKPKQETSVILEMMKGRKSKAG